MDQGSSGWQGGERRTNHRLRAIIDELMEGVRGNRQAIEGLAERLGSIEKTLARLTTAEPR